MTNNIVRKRPILLHRGRHRAKRPQTFKSAELAKKYAEAKGMKNYDIVALNFGISKKFKVVQK